MLKMVSCASYLFLKTLIEDFTGLLYGWVWLKIVEIIFLSFVTCYPLLEAVNLLCLLHSNDLLGSLMRPSILIIKKLFMQYAKHMHSGSPG